MSGIAFRGVTKSFGGRRALDGVSLDVAPGTLVALVGPSGSGKTTLLRCAVRLLDPDGGEMHLAGHPMHALRGGALARARRDVGFVFQGHNLVRRLSALDNALSGRLAEQPLWRVLLRAPAASDERDARAALGRVGLGAHASQRADTLSGGQRQRVAIARALVQRAGVILADEPVASLDPDNAAAVLSLLRDLAHADGVAILCSLHQHDLAARYADRVVAMSDLDGHTRPERPLFA